MAVIQGAITDYQTVTHVTGNIVGEVGGSVSSTHIATFQISGQTVQLRSAAPAGLTNGDVIRVTGQRNSGGIFEALYYFNTTRKCHSPPPKFGISRFLVGVFLFTGIAILLGCLLVDWVIYADNNGTDLLGLISSNVPAGLVAVLFLAVGLREKNRTKAVEHGYRKFISGT